MPIAEISEFSSVLPIVGPALLLKEMMAANTNSTALLYALPVLGSSICYSLLALWWAIDQFSREEVLFREAERFEFKAWVKHLLRDKEPIPSFSAAAFCFILIMLTQFGILNVLRQAQASGNYSADQLLMIQQLVMLATPALMMGLLLTTSMRRTFRFNLPKVSFWFVAGGLALVLQRVRALGLEARTCGLRAAASSSRVVGGCAAKWRLIRANVGSRGVDCVGSSQWITARHGSHVTTS